MRTYLVTFPDISTADTFLQRLRNHGAPSTWIAVDPDPGATNENEHRFTDEKSWDELKDTVAWIINDQLPADQLPADTDQPAWPTVPFDKWSIHHKRILITMAVRRWGYLGPNGPDPARIMQDYENQRLPFQAWTPHNTPQSPPPGDAHAQPAHR